jgi:predicted HTH domain antitoxin
MKTIESYATMNVQVKVDDWLSQNKTQAEIKEEIKTGLILFEYLKGQISLGEIAEHYKKSIEDTMNWMNDLGIPTSRKMCDELENISYKNMKSQLEKRGITYP